MLLLSPQHFSDYELIDSGLNMKLERFGNYILIRPEPQAIWQPSKPIDEWKRTANAHFQLNSGEKGNASENSERGKWILKPNMPEQWQIKYNYNEMRLTFRLGLTAFKHVGVFPEQASNWNYIFDTVREIKDKKPSVLNLFAYTGGASIAAKAAGAEVTHVDSVKQVISWSRENMELSKLTNIRWIVDDALKFVQREARRGNKYNGIILDPPAYGRGPDGEKWILEKSINELVMLCKQILKNKNAFLILNLYSMGFSPLVAESLINSIFSNTGTAEMGELFLPDQFGKKLPMSIYYRFKIIA
jgi:23S rRNA (cytosine1962-C5)-methyltransferase